MWKNIFINKQNIVYDNCSSVLIKMPNNSEYSDYYFWHPSKLIRNGSHSFNRSIGYSDEFKFKLFKYGKGKYNSKQIVSRQEIGTEELEIAFEMMNNNLNNDDASYLIVNEPTKITKKVEVIKDLINE